MHSNGRLNHGEAPDRIRICRKTRVLPELHRIPGGNTPACLVSASLARAYASDLRGTVKQRMVTVLAELGLAERATSITGLSAVGAASVLAEAGHPRRFAASGRPRQPLIAADQQQATLTAGASPTRHRDLWISAHIQGSPAPRRANPITRCRAPSP